MKMKFFSLLLLVSMLVSLASARKVPTPVPDPPSVLLELSVVNRAFYLHDQPDYSLLASTPNAVFPIGVGKTFTVVTGIGDIVQMNGRPAKGTFAAWTGRKVFRDNHSCGLGWGAGPALCHY